MTPQTKHYLYGEIRIKRAELTELQKFLQSHGKNETTEALFHYIFHKRKVLKYEESLLGSSATE